MLLNEKGEAMTTLKQRVVGYVRVITDAGYSAKNLKRPGIEELYQLVAGGEVDGVVVSKLDRLTRSIRDLHMLLEGLFNTIDLHSVSEKVDTNSASGRLVLNVLMSVAEWEREAISEASATARSNTSSSHEGSRTASVASPGGSMCSKSSCVVLRGSAPIYI